MKIIPLLLAGLSGLALASEAPAAENPPKGLASSDWSSIRAAYEAGRHAVHRQENGTLTARNPGQQWRTEFDGKGFTVTPDHGQWTWGLELIGYGERTLLSAPSSLTHDGGKITSQRDENLTEWFINDTRGLEQGWTISSRSVGVSPTSENLTLTLTLRGDLHAQVSPDSSSVSFQTASGGTALTYGGLKAWDADGKILPVRFEDAGENSIRIAVDEQTARYPITVDPVAQQAYLKASNTASGDGFGGSVAVSGDTVVIGAPGKDSSFGAAYVFVRSGVTWSQQAYLTGSSPYFGCSVGISGDTIIVGAYGQSSNTGAAYVFTRSGGSWNEQAYLVASNPGIGDLFGVSVAVSGDTVVVGAMEEDSSTTGVNSSPDENTPSSGAAYIFTRSGTDWSQQAYLKASNPGGTYLFGQSVSISGDTVIVGSPLEGSSTTGINSTPNVDFTFGYYSGAAYVFKRTGTTWSQEAYLKASNTGQLDQFGNSVAVSGDTAVVGAPIEASNATGVNGEQMNDSARGSGAVYVFKRSGTTWSQQAYLKASNTEQGDNFGQPVTISGDYLVVGSAYESSSTTGVNSLPNEDAYGSGAAYVFVRNVTSWSQQAYLKASNTASLDLFAKSVAVSGATVIIGAEGEDSNATGANGDQSDNSASNSGAAYIFDLNAPGTLPEIAIEQSGTNIANGATKGYGPVVAGTTSDLIFTILNTGTSDITLTGTPKVAVSGSSDFTVTAQPVSPITGPSGSSNFTVRFTPTGSGLKSATLSIPNNDGDENPFVINLTGTALSFSTDGDNDGLNDASEFNMAALGFNWQVGQTALVNAYYNNANGTGLYTTSQVQALNTGTPLIARDPATGKFKLIMDWKKSTNLSNFLDFPAPIGSAVSISPQGDVEFEFPSTDNAAFYRIEVD